MEADGGNARYVERMPEASCRHPADALSSHGSNQFGLRLRCMACDTLLVRNGRRAIDTEHLPGDVAAAIGEFRRSPESRHSRDGSAGTS